VETEAYSVNDPACHAYKRVTSRNKVMFGESGFLYIFNIYGIHHCLNLVTDQKNTPSAVLIRAIELTGDLNGLDIDKAKVHRTASGPGKLCKFLNIDKTMNGMPINIRSSLLIYDRTEEMKRELINKKKNIVQTTRIGITKGIEIPWRFYLEESKAVSVRVPRKETPYYI
jgi:DNA-3-methyladenine glycosylase